MNKNSKDSKYRYTPELYSNAFMKLFNCSDEEFQITVSSDHLAALIVFQNNKYLIEPYSNFFTQLKDQLTDVEQAQYVDFEHIIKTTTGITKAVKFHTIVIQKLSSEQERVLYNLALSISTFCEDQHDAFWRTLWPLDDTGILIGKAVTAAASYIGEDLLTKRILQIKVDDGIISHDQMPGGVLKSVTIDFGYKCDTVLYIYRVDNSTIID